MQANAIDAVLEPTLADHKFTASERNSLLVWLETQHATPADLNLVRSRAFALGEAALPTMGATATFGWLQEIVRTLAQRQNLLDRPTGAAATLLSALFVSPDNDCPAAILRLMRETRETLDIAVFTITDDRVGQGIYDAKKRGVVVRIITDNEKMLDLGSDIQGFEQAGIPVRVDFTQYHMHHKFAIFDRSKLMTGSYNWTRGAALNNEEHFIVTNDPTLLTALGATFERLWTKLEPK